jgi:uncharacterized LabA/DUF88 family protein
VKHNPECKADYGKALYMTPEEKRISFLNRYFVFKKVRNVNTDKIHQIISKEHQLTEQIEEEVHKELDKNVSTMVYDEHWKYWENENLTTRKIECYVKVMPSECRLKIEV